MRHYLFSLILLISICGHSEIKFKDLIDHKFQYTEVGIYTERHQPILSIYSYSFLNELLMPISQFDLDHRVYFSRRIDIPVQIKIDVVKINRNFSLAHKFNSIKFGKIENIEGKYASELFSPFQGVDNDYSVGLGVKAINAVNRVKMKLASFQLGSIIGLFIDEKINIGYSSEDITIEIVPLTREADTNYYLDMKYGPTYLYRKYQKSSQKIENIYELML